MKTAIVVSYWFAATMALGQVTADNARKVTFQANEPRPLAAILKALQEKFDWETTYEDPMFEFAGDWEDRRAMVQGVERVTRGAKFKPLRLEVNVPAHRAELERGQVGLALFNAYLKSGNPGMFKFTVTKNKVLHFYPGWIRDNAGKEKAVGSLLDTRVTLALGERNALSAISEVVHQVSERTKVSISLGSYPTNALRQAAIKVEANNEPARTVLLRILEAIHNFRSPTGQDDLVLGWRLYNTGTNSFFFNVNWSFVKPEGRGLARD